MSAKKTRQTVDPEFKRAALKLVADNPDRSKTSIARELGIEPNALYTWVAEAKKHPEHAFPGNGNSTDELATLRRELKLVTQERDILKNALADSIGECNIIFVNQHLEDVAYGTNGKTGAKCLSET